VTRLRRPIVGPAASGIVTAQVEQFLRGTGVGTYLVVAPEATEC
jgi:hypothetical protein